MVLPLLLLIKISQLLGHHTKAYKLRKGDFRCVDRWLVDDWLAPYLGVEYNSIEAPAISLVSPRYFLLNRCHETLVVMCIRFGTNRRRCVKRDPRTQGD